MLHLGLLSLIGAVSLGVFGFGVNAPDVWTWQKIGFFILMTLAAGSFAEGTMSQPSPLWEYIDDKCRNRYRRSSARSRTQRNQRTS